MVDKKIELENIKAGDTIRVVVDKKNIIEAFVLSHGIVPDFSKIYMMDGDNEIHFDDCYSNGIVFSGHGPKDLNCYFLITDGPDYYFYALSNDGQTKSNFQVFAEDCDIEFFIVPILLLEIKSQ